MGLFRINLKRLFRFLLALVAILICSIAILFYVVSSPPEKDITSETTINDVTNLNPIEVGEVKQPRTSEEIIALVKKHEGPISIGGARHSMGGQIGTEQALHLDMRDFDEIVYFSEGKKEIVVQTGITWRKLQEFIDPYNLSVKIMQTYADFTVGGSLSVNVHGRYVGQGPLINSVRSIKVVLADGALVEASPAENAELFYGFIGGYGGLGVIVEATLQLTDNQKLERASTVMPANEYHDYFFQHVRNDSSIIFHNADIYPNDYNEVRSVSYKKTEKTLTEEDRLRPLDKDYRIERFAMWLVSEAPGGKWIRRNWGDPALYSREKVIWRNHEASYHAMELEPRSRKHSTYVLQEYFVPVAQFDSFVPKLAGIFQRHETNVINVSIRHAKKDPGSLLAWAPVEVFCFVVYYKQGTTEAEKEKVGRWTRELIDAALAEGGSYYLPYQLHATVGQFRKAYPNADQFFALKEKVDPTNKFRNKLWDKYGVRDN